MGGCVVSKSGRTSQEHGDKLGKRSKAAHPGPHTLTGCFHGARGLKAQVCTLFAQAHDVQRVLENVNAAELP